jgi:hypothetical protein
MSWEAPVRFRVSVVVATLLLTGCNANLSSRNGPRGRRRPQLSGLQSLQSHQLSTEQQPSGRCDNPAPPVSELAAGDGPAHRHGGRGRRRPHGATRRRVWVRNGPPSINARRLHSLTQDLIFGNEPELSSAPASDEKGNREIWLEPHILNKLRTIRGPGESYSNVILRLAKGSRRARRGKDRGQGE